MRKGLLPFLLVAIAAVATAGAAGGRQNDATLSPTWSADTYRATNDRVELIVDAWPASLRTGQEFVPIPVAVGVRGRSAPIRFHEESFTLVDAAGDEYPMASYNAVAERYPMRTFDRTMMAGRPLAVGTRFYGLTRVPSRFFPAPGAGTRTTSVELSAFSWFEDVLYFPRPADVHGPLTLRLKAAGLEQPVEVRFEVQKNSVR